jgi:cellulose synthase/poly-beta-1,6-N-acetylglucosamine synthase-like glycosyltransferase
MISQFIFYFCVGALLYVFLLFPLGILIIGSLKRRESAPRWDKLPAVTVIFSAYNEEQVIQRKIFNTLSLDYPENKLNLIVVDDCSQDHTWDEAEKVNSLRVKVLRQLQRRGKTGALNLAAAAADGEVLVFTDANAMYQPDAIRRLVEAFDREGTVGVVTGSLRYEQHPSAVSDEESLYQRLETKLKEMESRAGTLTGAYGSIYAMPCELYEPLREDLISDFMGPLLLCRRGYRTIHESRAIAVETGTRSLSAEFRRKRRIVQRSLHGLWVHRDLLNPFQSGWLAVQIWSHKVLRWLTPLWLLGVLVSTFIMVTHPAYRAVFILLLSALAAGLLGYALRLAGRPPGIFRYPSYGLMVVAATLCGLWDWLRGKYHVTWEPQR